ncbi:MAG: lipopolysaccharide transport system ATP-binding protein [Psychromonas sp.]|jgi:lipopolysaccharide transport system ATP-binding protein
MSETVISVEGLYKQYRLGQVGTGTMAHDFNRWWHKVRGKEDPYEIVTAINQRDQKAASEYVWALQDINFEVKRGEVLGIIGKNGAGKSTLLKILSKVTSPTKGQIGINGRIASLLEVGTGFHPELTGRENIFLNGAILGMTKTEIRSKFDEIVDFSGVDQYIDTPVKRYSSGMYVRLAFAVAAHLEPEILIVDEVLAVGDAEFQKKCLGKMKDVSKEGRTVLFVSHNMGSISSLCDQTIWLENGKVKKIGESGAIISQYLKSEDDSYHPTWTWPNKNDRPQDEYCALNGYRIIDENREIKNIIRTGEKIGIEMDFEFKTACSGASPNLVFDHVNGQRVFQSIQVEKQDFKAGNFISTCWIPENLLNDESYILTLAITTHNPTTIHFTKQISFDVLEGGHHDLRGAYRGKMHGVTRPKLIWD